MIRKAWMLLLALLPALAFAQEINISWSEVKEDTAGQYIDSVGIQYAVYVRKEGGKAALVATQTELSAVVQLSDGCNYVYVKAQRMDTMQFSRGSNNMRVCVQSGVEALPPAAPKITAD